MKNTETIQDELVKSITEVYNEFINYLELFTEEQINELPFPDSWTAGQVTEHIIKATGGIPDKYTGPPDRAFDKKVNEMESVFLDFNAKFKSPDFIVPGNGPFNKSALIKTLNDIRAKHIHNIKEADLTAVCLNFELPTIGTMTRYEWYRFIIAHMKRHLFQLKNIFTALATSKIS